MTSLCFTGRRRHEFIINRTSWKRNYLHLASQTFLTYYKSLNTNVFLFFLKYYIYIYAKHNFKFNILNVSKHERLQVVENISPYFVYKQILRFFFSKSTDVRLPLYHFSWQPSFLIKKKNLKIITITIIKPSEYRELSDAHE